MHTVSRRNLLAVTAGGSLANNKPAVTPQWPGIRRVQR
jgi:hypothetical protein